VSINYLNTKVPCVFITAWTFYITTQDNLNLCFHTSCSEEKVAKRCEIFGFNRHTVLQQHICHTPPMCHSVPGTYKSMMKHRYYQNLKSQILIRLMWRDKHKMKVCVLVITKICCIYTIGPWKIKRALRVNSQKFN